MTSTFPQETWSQLEAPLRDFAMSVLRPAAAEADDRGEIPRTVLSNPWVNVLSAAYIPLEYGGGLADPATGTRRTECSSMLSARVTEELAVGDPGLTCALPGPSLVFPVLKKFGTEEQKSRYLPRFCQGTPVWSAFAITEAHCGSDAHALRTKAEKVAGGYVLNGTKTFVTNGARSDFALVFATVDPSLGQFGQRVFIVESSYPGFSIGSREKMLGLRASGLTEIVLSQCFVPENNLLRDETGKAYLPAVQGPLVAWNFFRIEVSSIAVGIARAVFEELKDHYNTAIPELERDIHIGRLLCQEAARRVDDGISPAYRVSVAKAYTARLAMNATLQAINLIGPQSLEQGHLIERLFRAAKAFDILEGTGEIQREHIVRNFKPEQANA